MSNVTSISSSRPEQKVAKCKVLYVSLAIAYYANEGEPEKAKQLVQALLNADLSSGEMEISQQQMQLLERSNPVCLWA